MALCLRFVLRPAMRAFPVPAGVRCPFVRKLPAAPVGALAPVTTNMPAVNRNDALAVVADELLAAD